MGVYVSGKDALAFVGAASIAGVAAVGGLCYVAWWLQERRAK